ncbi:MAG: hypothetical protein GEV06_25805 [Luteitalea sp.]|nr:hypothetical protein [Luteitalea sp.]
MHQRRSFLALAGMVATCLGVGGAEQVAKVSDALRESPRPLAGRADDSDRPLHISDADASIVKARLSGPRFFAPEVFHGAEDYYNPRVLRLRSDYNFLEAIEGEEQEFNKLLVLRHWVHRQWPIDDDQRFSGDAFAILEEARKTGAGFHCGHSMTVQQAVLTAAGYVARNLGIDRSHEKFGRSFHHGINEVWSNDYAKWVALDAKYDLHFERDGVPLSALELHEALRESDGEGVQMVKGVDRQPIPRPDPEEYGGRIDSYWWVSYHVRQNTFTQPHFSGGSSLVIFDNNAFRQDTWYRGADDTLAKHWAYAAGTFIPVADRRQIEWTPGVTSLDRIRQVERGRLRVDPRSATPNFKEYRYRINGGPWQSLEGGQRIDWLLREGENTLEVRTRTLFGVDGPRARATIEYTGPTATARTSDQRKRP